MILGKACISPAAQEPATANEDEAREAAARLELDNPQWIVIYGAFTHQFIAFPRFSVPPMTMAAAYYAAALPGRMQKIENRELREMRPARETFAQA